MAHLLDQHTGHSQIIQQLRAAIAKQTFGSCQLFVGPSGIGKKQVALGLIQDLMCTSGPPACGICPTCQKIAQNAHEEVLYIEPDGLQIKVQQSRMVLDFLSLQKLAKNRCVLIDNVQSFNPQAANTLLKILEEPPEGTYFFLISNNEKSILQTIRSRSHITRFPQLSPESLQTLAPQTQKWILNAAQGRYELIEQLENAELDEIRKAAFYALENINNSVQKNTIENLKESIKNKDTALFIIQCWLQMIRDYLLLQAGNKNLIHADLSPQSRLPESFSSENLHRLYQNAARLESDIYRNTDRNLAFENFIRYGAQYVD